eukprot:TRINITY_DN2580_c0_g1_i1.p1 TRINITY_DN2580_c0_g1~~TRINITY_DN2580_c0_g1_i1.p1  ORF type:complete len:219 (+),score=28.95 TRINITY_DN2580_c0_g1_i1:64-657(+)
MAADRGTLRFTLIWRATGQLPLAASTTETESDAEDDRLKRTARQVLEQLAGRRQDSRFIAVEQHGKGTCYLLHDEGVLFLTHCSRSRDEGTAFAFLEELAREFAALYGTRVASQNRPYPFMRFETFIMKTKRVYTSSATARSPPPGIRRITFNSLMGLPDRPAASGRSKSESPSPGLVVAGAVLATLVLLLLLWFFV